MRYNVADHGTFFSTRSRGAAIRGDLEAKAGDADRVEVDFAGVQSVSYSFLDCFVGELLTGAREGTHPYEVTLVNLDRELEWMAEHCRHNRGLQPGSPEPTAVA